MCGGDKSVCVWGGGGRGSLEYLAIKLFIIFCWQNLPGLKFDIKLYIRLHRLHGHFKFNIGVVSSQCCAGRDALVHWAASHNTAIDEVPR